MAERRRKRKHPVLRGILKAVLIVVLAVVVYIGGFAAYLTATEYKPSAVETLAVNGEAAGKAADGETDTGEAGGDTEEIKVMTWNIGYGALGESADFFMDGGSHVYTADEKQVRSDMYGITKAIREADPDVVFLQEVDRDSSRSHHVDERAFVENNTTGYCDTFATNYRVAYIPVPVPPLGKMDAGIMTLSKYEIEEAERIALPCPFSWPYRLGNLKRCISINRASVAGGKDNLSLVNLHLEAYDSGEGKKAQTKLLREYLDMEYEDGNYVIAAGDFNQSFSDVDTSMYPQLEGMWHCGQLDCDEFSDHWQFAMDTSVPSCRSLDRPYRGTDHDADSFQYYMIDGFIVSDNLTIEKVETLDLGFKNADHNPVVITLKLNGTSNTRAENTEETVEETPEPVKTSVTIQGVGDCSLGKLQIHSYGGSFLSFYDNFGAGYFFGNVKDVFDTADLTFANLEGVLSKSDQRVEKTFNIEGPPEYASILTAAGIDAVGTGNNHIMDYGEQGAKDTWNALTKAKIPYAYNDHTCLLESGDGIKVGLVAVNVLSQGSDRETYIKEGIENLKGQGADVIVVMAHWGIEGTTELTEYQKTLGHEIIDWGADLVLGCHTHCLQGMEEYRNRIIVYSEGNFCFGGNLNPKDKDTMIYQQTFHFTDGKPDEDVDVKVYPCRLSSVNDRNDFRPTPAKGDEAERIIKKLNSISQEELSADATPVVLDAKGNYTGN